MKTSEIADKILKSLPTKQNKDPYIWNYNIKVRTKDGKYDYEKETKEKVKVKKIGIMDKKSK